MFAFKSMSGLLECLTESRNNLQLRPLHLVSTAMPVRVLSSLCHANLEVSNRSKDTPLLRAAYQANFDVVDELLRQGANVAASDCCGCTVLIAASATRRNGYHNERHRDDDEHRWHAQGKVIQRLLECGAQIDSKDDGGMTAIAALCLCGNVTLLDLLLRWGADRTIVCDGDTLSRFIERRDDVMPPIKEAMLQRLRVA